MKLRDFFRRYKKKDKKGFTVVEMIAVVAVLAITSTASISIFIAVRNEVVQTSHETTDQFNISETEKYIRNELQVASAVDIYQRVGTSNVPQLPSGKTLEPNDEFIIFDSAEGCVYFVKVNEAKAYETKLKISDVKSVSLNISPVNYKQAKTGGSPADVAGSKLKLVYKIQGPSEVFEFSGGMILNNTRAGRGITGQVQDQDMHFYTDPGSPPYSAELNWTTTKANNEDDNIYILKFHSEYSKDTTPP